MTNEICTRQRWPVKLECLIVHFKLLSWSALGCNSLPLTLNLQLKSVMCKGVVIMALWANRENKRDRAVEAGLSNVEGNQLHPGPAWAETQECTLAVKSFRNPTGNEVGLQPPGINIKGKGIAHNRGLGLSGLSWEPHAFEQENQTPVRESPASSAEQKSPV